MKRFNPLPSHRRFSPISEGTGDDEPEWVRKSKMRHGIEFKLQSAHTMHRKAEIRIMIADCENRRNCR